MHELPQSIQDPSVPENFVDHLGRLVRGHPDQVCLTVVDQRDGRTFERTLTYAALDERVRALAALLQRQLTPGDRALVLLNNDEHYAVAMLACFYSGVIAVPVFPPKAARSHHVERLTGIAADARACCLLVPASLRTTMEEWGVSLGSPIVIAVDDVGTGHAGDWTPHSPAPHAIAFLQYTSGSTSAPKGVMVTHANLMANERAMQCAFDLGPRDRIVSWQPLYHDMGLIGGLLQPLFSGFPLVLTSPEYFLERPVRWLELISRFRATVSTAPDFAFRLCTERIREDQLAHLDLSCWRIALSGSEPIRSDTLIRFGEKFAAAGFAGSAVCTAYGLAEATLLVTAGRAGKGVVTRTFSSSALSKGVAEPSAAGAELVSCGTVAPEHRIEIVDAATAEPVADGCIGEIWVDGPSVSIGYWEKPAATEAAFVERRGGRWLRTGDLGFLHQGQLYVAGRIKDIIIVRGHNIYPQDVERAIEQSAAGIRKGRVAAFALDGEAGSSHSAGIGVAVEISRAMQRRMQPHELVDALSAVVAEQFGEPLSVVLLLNPGALPRTSSGKLQRAACRKGWQDVSLDAYALFEGGRFVFGGAQQQAARPVLNPTEAALAAIWKDVLRRDTPSPPGPEAHFFNSGGNSLAAVQMAGRIADHWNIDFPVSTIFELPRLGALAQEIERLSHANRGRQRPSFAALPPQRRSGPLPLSHAQERQWFLWQLDRCSSAYHVNVGLRLTGHLRADALQAALSKIVQRHEALRTVFRLDDAGRIAQYIQPECSVTLAEIDLSGPAEDAFARELQARLEIQNRSRLPFDLHEGPLLRATLLRLSEQSHLFAITMHHIVTDGYSMQVLIDELAQYYNAYCREAAMNSPRLPALPVQYADYAVWSREWLESGEAERQLAYWREQLPLDERGLYPVLALPTDQPRSALARYRAACHEMEISPELTHQLRRRAQEQGATLPMVLLAGFAALLYRYTHQEDLRIGVPVANRQLPQTAGIVGLFVNTLVIRAVMHGRMPFAELLSAVRTAMFGAQAHQDVPFEQLVRAIQPQRSLSYSALFQVMFNFLREDDRELRRMTGVDVSLFQIVEADAQFELMLDARERADGSLYTVFTYAAELFGPLTIARMAGHYQALLAALAEDAGHAIGDVQYMAAHELEMLRTGFAVAFPPALNETVQALIEKQAHLQPDAMALVCDGETLSYSALNRRANVLSRKLRGLGVCPERAVAVLTERTSTMVVSLLACFKAGGVYVPLDPSHPPARLLQILSDSGATVLLAQSHLAREIVPDLPEAVRTVLLDEGSFNTTADGDDPHVRVHPRNLAYLIYTSGSTGQPKAVAVEQGALSMHIQAMIAACEMTPADRMLQFAPISVDAGLEQCLMPLAAGACVVLKREWSSLATELELTCERYGVTAVDFPPAYARQLLQNASAFRQPLRVALIGGEAWTADDLSVIRRVLRPQLVINAYGPTEAVITPTLWRSRANDQDMDSSAGYVPIGTPLGQRCAYVLDPYLQPVPEGIPGELYLGGGDVSGGLARGYLNRADLTAERFIANPFSHADRLYRTGDLVRWRKASAHAGVGVTHDVQLEYLERLDNQVKISGFRIELREIEACLRQQPYVREAAAIKSDVPVGSALVAYVSPQPGCSLDAADLKERLRDALPDYMVPAAIVVLENLPLNSAGKVDRSRLPAPALPVADRPAYEAPRGPVMQTIAAVWSEVLGVEQVGIHDNFFDLGGSSLLLIRMHELLEQRLSAGLSVTDLFRHPTVATLARRIERAGAASQSSGTDATARDSTHERARLKRAALHRRSERAHRIQR